MSSDPLLNLLKTADAATPATPPEGDLAARVRSRQVLRATQSLRLRRIATAAIMLLLAAPALYFSLPRLADSPRAFPAAPDQIAAQADALQRQVDLTRRLNSRADLLAECRRRLPTIAQADIAQSAIDEAAAIAICQGDFYRDASAIEIARQSYETVLDHFPDSHWAVVARDRIKTLTMN